MIAMNKDLFLKNAVEGAQPVLVEFWAPWCVYCRRIAPAYDKIAEQYADKLVVGKINVDENPELAAQFGVTSIPTLMVMEHGQIINQAKGARPKKAILNML